jgi:hypothetical protein
VNDLEQVRRLMDEYLTLSETPENKRRLSCWEREVCARDQWHGRPRAEAFRREGAIPLTVDLQNTFWLQLFPQDMSECYHDPVAYLRFHLQKRIEQFRRLPDDTPLDGIVPIYMSTAFETSLFGMPPQFFPDKDPIIDMHPIVHALADLGRLDGVDFRQSGMMPAAHRLYEGVREMVGDRFSVIFVEWLRGPLGVSLYLRGYQDLLQDLAIDPEFAHSVLDRVNRAREDWFRARAQFLGEPVPAGSIFNDEVDSSVIGPRHYREHVLPYEKALGEFHERISYWHSCGNTAPMDRDVAGMGCVDLLDISGWTDLAQALPALDGRVPRLEIRSHPLKDLQQASPERMAERVREVVDLCRRYDVPACTLRVSGLQPWSGDLEADIAHVQRYLEIARRVIEAPAS